MKVLFVAAESVPFVKTGGLADVIGALPQELVKLGIDVRVVMPKYSQIADEFKQRMSLQAVHTVPLSWRQQYGGIEQLTVHGVPHYFIDNEYYFKRDSIYGSFDDAERFAYFSKAVLELLPEVSWQPDIIHCHDWHTGPLCVFLKTHYAAHPFYQNVKTVFTIHNLQYQGVFPYSVLGDILGLSDEYFTFDKLEFYGQINFMKAGLVYADRLSTVSPTYAKEIQYEYFGEHLDGLLRSRSHELEGILNGIDIDSYNPLTDPNLLHNDHSIFVQKQENKTRLQEELYLPVDPHTPLLAMITRLTSQKGLDLVLHVMEEILAMDLQVVILGSGEAKYEHALHEIARRHPHKFFVKTGFDEALARKIYIASDLFLMPSVFEPCGLSQMIAMRYGSIPIVRETGGLRDTVSTFNEYTGKGNGFSFANMNAHDMLYTIRRALTFYRDKSVWQNIVENAVSCNFSWTQSASSYRQLYKKLL